jgi:nucleoside-diphosphate-sugar epimerase
MTANHQYLHSTFVRSSEPLDHLAGKSVTILGDTGFYGSWFKKTLEYANEKGGLDIRIRGLSRASGFDICNLPENMGGIRGYVINCAGSSTPKTNVEMYPHMDGPLELRKKLDEDVTLLHFSSGAAQNALTPYGINKQFTENGLLALGGKTQIVRPFATVGHGMGLNKPFAVSAFLRARLAGHPLIVSQNEIRRSFVHISDLVTQCLHVMIHGDNRPYDVGSDDVITVREAALLISDRIVEVANSAFPSNAGVDTYSADLTRIRSHFNLSLDMDSKSAILRTLNDYLREHGFDPTTEKNP